jgi:antirestriction protein ArdC
MDHSNPIRRDLHAEITNQLIAAIEADPGRPTLPWRKSAGALHMPVNAHTGKAYSGINILNLWVSTELTGRTSSVWGTYRQWAELGAQVRKGEKASLVIFYKEYESEPNPDDADDTGKRRVARASSVFNADQVDGYAKQDAVPDLGPIERITRADSFTRGTGALVRHGGDRAYFDSRADLIQMPDEGLFTGTETMSRTEGYYATLTHELVHWSGASSRLDRTMGKRFGDKAYAAEELVAEIGAAFLCAELGITQEVRLDHAQYLANWLQLLKDDKKVIFTAAARAAESAAFLRRGTAS